MYCSVPGRGQSAGGGCEGEQEQERESERVSLLVKPLFEIEGNAFQRSSVNMYNRGLVGNVCLELTSSGQSKAHVCTLGAWSKYSTCWSYSDSWRCCDDSEMRHERGSLLLTSIQACRSL